MSQDHAVETAKEKRPHKKRLKALWIVLLSILLIIVLAIGGYLFLLNKAWNQAGTLENALPNEDGTTNSAHSEELQKMVDAASGEINGDTADNITDTDQNGDGILDSLQNGAVTDRPAETGATDILLLGSDSRAGTAESASVSGQRADTIMILHIPKDGSSAYLISVMRDTWVNIPGYGSAKVNAALNYGGVDLEVATIEQLTGVRIDHVAEVDFQGFKGLVDAVGGVTVQVPLSFTNYDGDYSFTQGPMTMDGATALAFVRERYVFSDGDYQRVRNQRAFLQGFIDTVKGQGALKNIAEFHSMVSEIAPYLTVSEGLTVGEIARIATPLIVSGNTDIHMMTLPNAGTGWSADGQSIVINSTEATSALATAYQNDDFAGFFATYGED